MGKCPVSYTSTKSLQDGGSWAEPDCPAASPTELKASHHITTGPADPESMLVTDAVLAGRDTHDLLQLQWLAFCKQITAKSIPAPLGLPCFQTKTPASALLLPWDSTHKAA